MKKIPYSHIGLDAEAAPKARDSYTKGGLTQF